MASARKVLPWCALVLLVVLPLLGAAVNHHREGWYPESDDATIVLLSRDTFSGDPPLVGMISTGGADLEDPELHHPGPLELYLLAPLTTLLGPATGSVATAVLIAGASVTAMIVGFGRLGGWGSAAGGALTAALLLWGLGGDAPTSVWNPYVVALPFACFLLFAAVASTGRSWALVWAVVFGSFVAQTHLSYAGLVGAVVLWLVAVCAGRAWKARSRPDGPPGGWRPHLVAVLVGAVLWTPPLVQQVQGEPGNLSQIWRSVTGDGGATVGVRALGELGRVVGVPGYGLRPRPDMVRVFENPSSSAIVGLALPWAVVLGLAVLAARRGRPVVWALATLSVAFAAGMATATRIPAADGIVYQYYALWMWPLAAVLWAVAAWAAWRLLPPDAMTRMRPASAPPIMAAGVAVALITVASLPRPGPWAPWAEYRRVAGDVAEQTASALSPDGTYVVRFRGATPYLSTGSAVVLALDARGAEVLVDPGAPTPVFPWREHRRYDGRAVDAEVWVVSGTDPDAIPEGGELVATTTTVDADRRAAVEAATAAVELGLEEDGVRRGPREPTSAADRDRVDDVVEEPVEALRNGDLAAMAARGWITVPGSSADRLFTLQRLDAMIDEEQVAVYVVEGSQRR